jgi:hypothetical protein
MGSVEHVSVTYPRNMTHGLGLSERFLLYADPRGPTDCWEWIGRRSNMNYGLLSDGGRKRSAHRVSWELSNGPIPESMCVLHRCDNPPCVNPAHLFLGTMSDNSQDMARKGRWRNVPRYGWDNNKTKLSDEQIADIRARYAAGEQNKSRLAEEYGVHRSRIYQLVNHKDGR